MRLSIIFIYHGSAGKRGWYTVVKMAKKMRHDAGAVRISG